MVKPANATYLLLMLKNKGYTIANDVGYALRKQTFAFANAILQYRRLPGCQAKVGSSRLYRVTRLYRIIHNPRWQQ